MITETQSRVYRAKDYVYSKLKYFQLSDDSMPDKCILVSELMFLQTKTVVIKIEKVF